MGWRVRDEGRVGLRTEVELGSNGDVEAGVIRALRVVDMLSSIEARDSRKKSRRTRVLKQNCGVRAGVGVGLDIMRLGLGGEEDGRKLRWAGCGEDDEEGDEGEGEEDGEFEGGDVQNHASLMVESCATVQDKSVRNMKVVARWLLGGREGERIVQGRINGSGCVSRAAKAVYTSSCEGLL